MDEQIKTGFLVVSGTIYIVLGILVGIISLRTLSDGASISGISMALSVIALALIYAGVHSLLEYKKKAA